MKSKAIKEERGITLVALVVTIVVLLILAGVSINLIVSEDGIMKRANEGKEKYEQAATNEAEDLNKVESWMEDQFGEAPEAATEETAPYFPDNTFTKKEGTINTGLVIQDSARNEYVWVVVPRTKEVYKTTNLGKTTFNEADYASIEKDLQDYTSAYRKSGYSDIWADDTANEGWFTKEKYTEAKNNMLKSVYLNGGFYVGRYEAGVETNRNGGSGKNENEKYDITGMPTPFSKADLYPYTYVTRTQAQKLAENVNSGNKTSSLMFGVQWDLVLAFMAKDTVKIKDITVLTSDSTKIGNYLESIFDLDRGKYAKIGQTANTWKNYNTELSSIVVNNTETGKMKKTEQNSWANGILLTTGATQHSKVMNIYDIAGNICEWTLEKSCVYRGDCCYNMGSEKPAAYHDFGSKTTNSNLIGFRVAIF